MLNRKKKRLQICVYCGKTADTKDHVVPVSFLEQPLPLNLPTVWSCQGCNVNYGRDEEYFLAVLSTSGLTPTLAAKVEEGGVVDRMLSRSPGLNDRITDALDVDENGRVYLNVEENRIARIVQKIAFGLYLHRYRRSRIPRVSQFRVWPSAHAGNLQNHVVVMAHTERLRSRTWIRLQRSVFEYMFARNWVWTDFGKLVCIMKFHETIWAVVSCPELRHEGESSCRRSVSAGQFALFTS